jgi:hypothetical protein
VQEVEKAAIREPDPVRWKADWDQRKRNQSFVEGATLWKVRRDKVLPCGILSHSSAFARMQAQLCRPQSRPFPGQNFSVN